MDNNNLAGMFDNNCKFATTQFALTALLFTIIGVLTHVAYLKGKEFVLESDDQKEYKEARKQVIDTYWNFNPGVVDGGAWHLKSNIAEKKIVAIAFKSMLVKFIKEKPKWWWQSLKEAFYPLIFKNNCESYLENRIYEDTYDLDRQIRKQALPAGTWKTDWDYYISAYEMVPTEGLSPALERLFKEFLEETWGLKMPKSKADRSKFISTFHNQLRASRTQREFLINFKESLRRADLLAKDKDFTDLAEKQISLIKKIYREHDFKRHSFWAWKLWFARLLS